MGDLTAPELPTFAAGETQVLSIDYIDTLDSGELLTGTPTAAEESTSDLTLSNVATNAAALTVNGRSVAIGQAVQAKVVGMLAANSPYYITVTASTDSSPARTLERRVGFNVKTE